MSDRTIESVSAIDASVNEMSTDGTAAMPQTSI